MWKKLLQYRITLEKPCQRKNHKTIGRKSWFKLKFCPYSYPMSWETNGENKIQSRQVYRHAKTEMFTVSFERFEKSIILTFYSLNVETK